MQPARVLLSALVVLSCSLAVGAVPQVKPSVSLRERCVVLVRQFRSSLSFGSKPTREPPIPKELAVKLAEVWHEAFEPKALTYKYDPIEDNLGADQATQVTLQYFGAVVARASIYLKGNTLRFDIWVEKEYRGANIYEHLMALAIARFPTAKSIPIRSRDDNSDNAREFIKNAFGEKPEFKNLRVENLSEGEAVDLRGRMLAALYKTPAFKVRERNGFGKITKLVFNPERLELSLYAEKGDRKPGEEVQVLIEQGNKAYELNADGKVSPRSESSLLLGDFPQFPSEIRRRP